jgi:hypothetical protein
LTSGTVSTSRVGTITVKSNDADESEFKISLSGQVLSYTVDSDGDDMPDYAEAQYAALGFDWKKADKALVTTFREGAAAAGYLPPAETAVKLGAPILTRDPITGKFTLQLSLEKSTDLKTYKPLEMNAGTFKNGNLEFEFTSPDNASFYRVLGK